MAKLSGLNEVWNTVKEMDLRPLTEQALMMVKIALVGRPGALRDRLAEQMRRDPARPGSHTQSPLHVLDLQDGRQADGADLIILLVDAGGAGDSDSPLPVSGRGAGGLGLSAEEQLTRAWAAAGKNVLVLVDLPPAPEGDGSLGPWIDWGQRRLLYGSVEDVRFLSHDFANAVVELLNNQQLSLGRHFPLFRQVIANRAINEACLTNATYSLSTGLAQIIPVFDLPLNVADMVVLSKNQAFLAYKLGLALGMSTRWQDYLAEFGGVLGSGFLWRQAARSLVGLIPLWGIVPKVAISYTGTYVVGHTVLQWYVTGRHLNSAQMRALTRQAYARGRLLAQNLARRAPRLKLPRPKLPQIKLPGGRKKQQAQLPAGADAPQALLPAAVSSLRECPNCGRQSAQDARFCQYCAAPL